TLVGATLSGNVAQGGRPGGPYPSGYGGVPGTGFGGGLYMGDGSTGTLTNDYVTGNVAIQGQDGWGNVDPGIGGGLWLAGSGTVTLTNDTVTGNAGGGIIGSATTVSLDSFTVANTVNNTPYNIALG